MNQDEYNQGRSMGAGSTQDQAAGARDAERERQRQQDEERERWAQTERLRDEQRRERDRQAQADNEQRQRKRQQQATADAKSRAPDAAGSPARASAKSTTKTASDARSLVTFVGFLAGVWIGWSWFPDNWPATLVVAAIVAAIGHAFHQLIIAAVVLGGGLWLWTQFERGDTTQPVAPPTDEPLASAPVEAYFPAPTAAEPEPVPVPAAVAADPAASAAMPIGGVAPGVFRIDNACPYALELFVEYRALDVAPQLLRWEIAGGARNVNMNDAAGQPILLASGDLLYQARLVDREWDWHGDVSRQFNDRTLSMRSVSLKPDAQGIYQLDFECASYLLLNSGPFLTPPPG